MSADLITQGLIAVGLLALATTQALKLWAERRDPVSEKQCFLADYVVENATSPESAYWQVEKAEDAWTEIQKRKVLQ